ncbi:dirigent protein 10-like [Miscanthus floridulus]|uniref:dirigent protein 10-like n=1 Tax=Miscanthus floridulus TaxID=154761 RepID=UPI003457DC20
MWDDGMRVDGAGLGFRIRWAIGAEDVDPRSDGGDFLLHGSWDGNDEPVLRRIWPVVAHGDRIRPVTASRGSSGRWRRAVIGSRRGGRGRFGAAASLHYGHDVGIHHGHDARTSTTAATGRSRAEGERRSRAVGGGERGVEREKGKQRERERELDGALWRWSRGGEERAEQRESTGDGGSLSSGEEDAGSAVGDEQGAGSATGDEVGAGSAAGDEVGVDLRQGRGGGQICRRGRGGGLGAGFAIGDGVGARSAAGEEVGRIRAPTRAAE